MEGSRRPINKFCFQDARLIMLRFFSAITLIFFSKMKPGASLQSR